MEHEQCDSKHEKPICLINWKKNILAKLTFCANPVKNVTEMMKRKYLSWVDVDSWWQNKHFSFNHFPESELNKEDEEKVLQNEEK